MRGAWLLFGLSVALAILAGACAPPAPAAPPAPHSPSYTTVPSVTPPTPIASASNAASPDREGIAAEARWAPGQLDAHFDKHSEGYRSLQDYDQGARDTIRKGTYFSYRDRESDARRLGFYDKGTNRFTSVTEDGRRITTHFKPDRGEDYVRRLEESTYR